MNQAAQISRGKQSDLQGLLKRIQKLFTQNRLKDAKPLCDQVYAQNVRSPDFLHLYGLTLKACGNLKNALAVIYSAHEQRPSDANLLNSLGLVFLDMQDTETAIAMFKRATTEDQKHYRAWENLGNALKSVERYNAAELAYVGAHHADRTKLEPLFNIAVLQADMRRTVRAAEIMDEILESKEKLLQENWKLVASLRLRRLQVAITLEDLDCVKQQQSLIERDALSYDEQIDLDRALAQYHEIVEQLDEAIAILETAAARKGKRHADVIAHLAFYYGLAGRIEDGISMLKKVLSKHPDHNGARFYLCLLQFRVGEIAEGFENYETRWRFRAFPSTRRTFDAPLWRGEPAQGKSILVWREQGVGDEVRFASLIPELQDRGCSITFECTEKLIPLWRTSFPGIDVRPEGELLCVNDPDYTGFDYQIPVGSLGRVFRRSIDDFHDKQKPWIARNSNAEARIREQLAIQPHELLVGVCWQSMNQAASRSRNFVNYRHLETLNSLNGVRWLNLQYNSTQEDIDKIRECGLDMHHYVDLDQKNDLVGACNLIGACDLVISVGVSVADLTGGVGTPMIYIGPVMSELYLGTGQVPWFVNSKFYPIATNKGDDTLARIVHDWPEISQWAECFKSEERKARDRSGGGAVPLDLEYPFAGEVVS